MDYQTIKMIHILSATIMIGTGLGSAFYLYITYKTAQFSTVRDVLKLVVLADLIFTTPSVIVQLITGLMLSDRLNLYNTDWFILVIILSFFILITWLGAVVIQYKLKKMSDKRILYLLYCILSDIQHHSTGKHSLLYYQYLRAHILCYLLLMKASKHRLDMLEHIHHRQHKYYHPSDHQNQI